ncbi:hypothetical protein EON64_04950 [archaeon]|nr:MAG: hypothetical protein EON64_04950 [archaeon]
MSLQGGKCGCAPLLRSIALTDLDEQVRQLLHVTSCPMSFGSCYRTGMSSTRALCLRYLAKFIVHISALGEGLAGNRIRQAELE